MLNCFNIARFLLPYLDCTIIIREDFSSHVYLNTNFTEFMINYPHIKLFKVKNNNEIEKLVHRLSTSKPIIFHVNNIMNFSNCMNISINHGTSDKMAYKKIGNKTSISGQAIGVGSYNKYDYYLFSGKKDLYNWKKIYSDINYVLIGNLKYHQYHNVTYSNNNLEKFKNKTILYSPTWFKNKNFFIDTINETCDQLTKLNYNILLRIHPRNILWTKSIKLTDNIIIDKNKYIIDSFKDADIMLSDFSSVAYDWLITGKPIILYRNTQDCISIEKKYNILNYIPIMNNIGQFEEKLKEFDVNKNNELLNNVFYQPDNKNILIESVKKIKNILTNIK